MVNNVAILRVSIYLLSIFFNIKLLAQNGSMSGYYSNKVIVPYPHLHQSNVMWSKQIWRVIDLREKMNQDFYFPTEIIEGQKSLMQLIWEGVTVTETITAYEDNKDGDLTQIIPAAVLLNKYNYYDTSKVENPATGAVELKVSQHIFKTSDVKQFRVKEEWYFDKQKSVLEARIIAICPIAFVVKNDEQRIVPMFWIYFPEARTPMKKVEVYNKGNNSEQMTYEEVFLKRKFSSFIYKESNVYNRRMSQYLLGRDGLLESERIKEEIMNMEMDLWEY
jgi:gliding motility associated protien GldN